MINPGKALVIRIHPYCMTEKIMVSLRGGCITKLKLNFINSSTELGVYFAQHKHVEICSMKHPCYTYLKPYTTNWKVPADDVTAILLQSKSIQPK